MPQKVRRLIIEPGYMHPRALKEKYSFSNERLAVLLGKSVSAVERYTLPSAKGEVPESVLIASWLMDFYLNQMFASAGQRYTKLEIVVDNSAEMHTRFQVETSIPEGAERAVREQPIPSGVAYS